MPDSAADRKSIRRREKAQRIAAAQRASVVRELMSTTQGREWIWDILASCHIFTTTYSGEALQSAFSEGERNVGLRLLADIMITCPDQYIQAQREHNARSATDERRSSTESDRGDSGSGDDPDESTRLYYDDNGVGTQDDRDEARTDH